MANTIDILGDDAVTDSIIDGSITEFVDDQVKLVGQYAFFKCSALTSVDLSAVTSVDSNAFYGCSKLASVDLPAATRISYYAFQNCSALTSVILRNTDTVATLESTVAFNGADKAIIYVPDDLVDDYKTATNWSSLADRIKGLSELPA